MNLNNLYEHCLLVSRERAAHGSRLDPMDQANAAWIKLHNKPLPACTCDSGHCNLRGMVRLQFKWVRGFEQLHGFRGDHKAIFAQLREGSMVAGGVDLDWFADTTPTPEADCDVNALRERLRAVCRDNSLPMALAIVDGASIAATGKPAVVLAQVIAMCAVAGIEAPSVGNGAAFANTCRDPAKVALAIEKGKSTVARKAADAKRITQQARYGGVSKATFFRRQAAARIAV